MDMDKVDSYQRETGLTDAVQTGIGELDGIPVALAVMDFQFIGILSIIVLLTFT
jgi:acetyl-CoA carboxylase carboxyl transferase subunit beta